MNDTTKDSKGLASGILKYLQKSTSSHSSQLPKIRKLFSKISDARKKQSEAIVITAIALKPEEKASIQQFIEKKVGQDVSLTCLVKPEVLGGIRITIGDWIIDTTLSAKMKEMAEIITE